MDERDYEWSPWFSGMVACEPRFAWRPVELWDGSWVWWRRVYKITARDVVYWSLTIPRNAL